MKKYDVELELTEEMLGTASADPELYEKFIASKRPDGVDDDELGSVPVDEEVEKSTTVFRTGDDGKPVIFDYMVKGFFKDACSMLRRVKGTHSSKLKAYKKEIDGLIFVGPRRIPLVFDGETGICERPLRAQTAQGERVALARSETVPAGTKIPFTITLLKDDHIELVDEWLSYGQMRGLGQWRNSGAGRFIVVRFAESKQEPVVE